MLCPDQKLRGEGSCGGTISLCQQICNLCVCVRVYICVCVRVCVYTHVHYRLKGGEVKCVTVRKIALKWEKETIDG